MTFRLTPQMSAALRAGRSPVAPLIEAVLPGHILRHLVGSGEVAWNGHVFRGRDPKFGTLVAAGNLKDGMGDEAPDWPLSFVPPDEAAAAELAAATAQGGAVRGWLAVVDRESGLVLPDPIQLFAGELDVARLRIGKGRRTVEWRCVSALEKFHDQEVGARLSDAWHRLIWPGETGLANMSGTEKTSYWGVEKIPSGVSTAAGTASNIIRQIFGS
jgi:hypothetical protein